MRRQTFVTYGSLTDGPCDILINASNTSMTLGSGVSGAIRMAARATGYILPEYIAMVEVVSQYFEIPPDTVPPEIVKHIAANAIIDD